METLAYENATPNDLGPPPMRGDVWILGCKYQLPRGTCVHAYISYSKLIELSVLCSPINFEVVL